jgi:hypothetical protein
MKRLMILVSAALALSACKTQQPALEQARHGVGLIAELEANLAEYRRLQSVTQGARAAQIRAQRDAMSLIEVSQRRDARARAAAGDKQGSELAARLVAEADAIGADDAEYIASLAANEAAMTALMAPLPSTRNAATEAQSALAVMGDQLTPEERRAEAKKWFDTVKAAVAKNKEAIDKAEAQASLKGGM